MTITVPRFEPKTCRKGVKFTIENKGMVIIKDHTTDRIIGMVNLYEESNQNIEVAEKIIEAIENYILADQE